MVEHPHDLRGGEIGTGYQARLRLELFDIDGRFQAFDIFAAAQVLPYEGVVADDARLRFPRNNGFPLVGDTDSYDIPIACANLGQRLANDFHTIVPNLQRIVLHPPGLGKNLLVFHLVGGLQGSTLIEQDESGAGCSLVQCADKFHGTLLKVWTSCFSISANVETRHR